ncbi:MAG: hypothetical protein ACRC1T_05170 [Clostridium chrysemydis]|uniref:hypothetical protein n=1 Tax=Clostridium chrysemydis TaxID=2665504 RepID=UPI003F41A88A
MGYCIDVERGTFSFDVDKADKILGLIKQGIREKKITEERWIDFNIILKSETIEEAFEELRFELFKDEDKYKIDYFSGEKFGGYEEQFFKTIAPLIDDGYLEYIGEDGEKWRYIFKNGECKEVYPKIVWEE